MGSSGYTSLKNMTSKEQYSCPQGRKSRQAETKRDNIRQTNVMSRQQKVVNLLLMNVE